MNFNTILANFIFISITADSFFIDEDHLLRCYHDPDCESINQEYFDRPEEYQSDFISRISESFGIEMDYFDKSFKKELSENNDEATPDSAEEIF